MAQMEYTLVVYSSNGKGIVKHKVMVKDKKKHSIKDAMLIKVSFMHYVKWTRVVLPVAFREFEVVYIFLLLFFSLSLSIAKGQLHQKSGGGGLQPLALPVSTGLFCYLVDFYFGGLADLVKKGLHQLICQTDITQVSYESF